MIRSTYFRLLASVLLACPFLLSAQVGINPTGTPPDSSAMLDVAATDKGLLMPRLTTAQRDAIANPATGLVIYNTDDDCFNYYGNNAWYKDCGRDLDADRADAFGEILITSERSSVRGVAVDGQGNVYTTGSFTGTLEAGDSIYVSTGLSDAYVMKQLPGGEVDWIVTGGGTGNESGMVLDVDNNGHVRIAISSGEGATIMGLVTSGNSLFFLELDAQGAFSDGYVVESLTSLRVNALKVAEGQGTVLLIDHAEAFTINGVDVPFAGPRQQTSVIKFAADGTLDWLNTITSATYVFGYDINLDDQGGISVAGEYEEDVSWGTQSYTAPGTAPFAVRYAADGSVSWGITHSSVEAYGWSMASDAAGNHYFLGEFNADMTTATTTLALSNPSEVFLTKIDPAGSEVWTKSIESTGLINAYRVRSTIDGRLTIMGAFREDITYAGVTTTIPADDDFDLYAISIDADGNEVWRTTFGGAENQFLDDAVSANGTDIYIAGEFRNEITLPNGTTVSQPGSNLGFVQQLTADGSAIVDNSDLAGSQDGDTDAANEIQQLSLEGNILTISGGNSVDLGAASSLQSGLEALRQENALLRGELQQLLSRLQALEQAPASND